MNRGYRVELSHESPKVLFCTVIGVLFVSNDSLYLHKNLFFKAPIFRNCVTSHVFKTFLKAAPVKCDTSKEFTRNPIFIRGMFSTPTNI